jgi:hypothetical protein
MLVVIPATIARGVLPMLRLLPIVVLAVLALVVILAGYFGITAMETLPGYLLEDATLTISNCSPPRDERAAATCERLHCWQAALASAPVEGPFELEDVERRGSPEGSGSVIVGRITRADGGAEHGVRYVRCVMGGNAVDGIDFLAPDEHEALARSGDLWLAR